MRPDWGVGAALLLLILAVLAALRAKTALQLTTAVFLLGCGATLAALSASSRGAGWQLSILGALLLLGFVLILRPDVHGALREDVCRDEGNEAGGSLGKRVR
jgi:hypothetical protein